MQTRQLTQRALLLGLLCISAYISIPLPMAPAPVVIQNLVLALIAYLYPPRQVFLLIATYLLIGGIGVPVFANGGAGWAYLMGPTSGYLFGFLIGYTVLSAVKGPRYDLPRYIVTGLLVGLPIVYICGMLGLVLVLHMDWTKAFFVGVLPFLVFDIMKTIIAAWLSKRIVVQR